MGEHPKGYHFIAIIDVFFSSFHKILPFMSKCFSLHCECMFCHTNMILPIHNIPTHNVLSEYSTDFTMCFYVNQLLYDIGTIFSTAKIFKDDFRKTKYSLTLAGCVMSCCKHSVPTRHHSAPK